jgi:GNAT superfamily N-acetyltransferase
LADAREPIDVRLLPYDRAAAPHVVRLWNDAIGDTFPLREPALRQCLEANPSARPEDGCLAWTHDGHLVGFGYAGFHRLDLPETARFRERGQIQAVVVDPAVRRQGLGRRIAGHLAGTARDRGIRRLEAGGGMFYLWGGLPDDLPEAAPFCEAIGFELGDVSWDLRGDITDLRVDDRSLALLRDERLTVEPATAADAAAALAFLLAEFGGEWWHETSWFLAKGGDVGTLLLLRDEGRRIIGLARIHRPDGRPIGPPHFWAARRAPAAGGLGPIGIATERRGQGLGRALLVVALDRLREAGLNDVVIDLTSLLGYYGSHGFGPWMTWRHGAAPIERVLAATRHHPAVTATGRAAPATAAAHQEDAG